MSIKFRNLTEFKKCNNKYIWDVNPVDESSNISLLFAAQDELSSLSANCQFNSNVQVYELVMGNDNGTVAINDHQ